MLKICWFWGRTEGHIIGFWADPKGTLGAPKGTLGAPKGTVPFGKGLARTLVPRLYPCTIKPGVYPPVCPWCHTSDKMHWDLPLLSGENLETRPYDMLTSFCRQFSQMNFHQISSHGLYFQCILFAVVIQFQICTHYQLNYCEPCSMQEHIRTGN